MTTQARLNEIVYQSLKSELLFGGFKPGIGITLRGLASKLAVSPTPIREAVKRLISERALIMNESRRVSVPTLSADSYADIRFARTTLEPQLAIKGLQKALDRQQLNPLIRALKNTDDDMDTAIHQGDARRYMQANYDFHFALYRQAQSPVLLSLVESLWLQMSPYLYAAFGRYGTAALAEDDFHKRTISALQAHDQEALKAAITEDILQGLNTFDTPQSDALKDRTHDISPQTNVSIDQRSHNYGNESQID